jgi:hypothetical protein
VNNSSSRKPSRQLPVALFAFQNFLNPRRLRHFNGLVLFTVSWSLGESGLRLHKNLRIDREALYAYIHIHFEKIQPFFEPPHAVPEIAEL